MEFLVDNLAPIMFFNLIVFLLLGFPVTFTLSAIGILYGLVAIELDMMQPALFQALPQRVFGIVENDTLLAVPFFTLMGLILERSGMAEDLLDTIGQLFGPLRGGLAIAVVLVGAMLAATTGVVSASVISMGLISLPIMLRYGYDRKLATGVIAASGTLSQIIPPSIVLIILADQLGRSIGDMYRGAMLPGLLLVAIYILYIVVMSYIKPKSAPALPPEARVYVEPNGSRGLTSLIALTIVASAVAYFGSQHYFATHPNIPMDEHIVVLLLLWGVTAWVIALINKLLKLKMLSKIAERVVFVMVPPLFLIFLVLGTIFIGVATPTEGGAMGAVGAIIMAVSRGRLSWKLLRQAMESTTRLSCFVVFILVGSTVFSLSFRGINGDLWVEHLLIDMPGGEWGFLIIVSILTFLLAFFLDFFELAFIIVPLLGPIADKMGIDLIWFGVLLAVNMQTSFMHPPFGFALFFLRSVAPKEDYTDKVTGERIKRVATTDIYWGSVPFIIIQLLMVATVLVFPGLVTHYKHGEVLLEDSQIQFGTESTYGSDSYGFGTDDAASSFQ
ncbi:TRAP transporter large permease [Alcaligenes sp. RM2]|jgi:TRAP-type mannitol/chloroaromatic compound transport system permease large subunit|uniref:TRAP transporter large permease n=1 Tax=Alcaligenes TaxID=507 RepID=UPI000396279E|nr:MULTISPECIES: TRAP transporter large permease subunit [Alcaligenes]ERI34127.1 C4-dicarboxylate ABC transporter [Alcaligenes sp. EGD-AK7]URW81264.1 TRAP transporter large permease subunit [Alcaligenes sp. DN25]UTM01129.1 TRAP transporter large permease subunit [Alcaligenes sp. NLF5-7]WEA66078.1 TRAP transporter large permease subunit [Alcaligenes faecalis]HRO19183.1 TRAP transporter large permease subunit [Alcaligenes phenolicus]